MNFLLCTCLRSEQLGHRARTAFLAGKVQARDIVRCGGRHIAARRSEPPDHRTVACARGGAEPVSRELDARTSRRRPSDGGAGCSVKHTCPGREVHGGAAQRVLVVGVWRQAVRHREHTFHLLPWFAARARTPSSAAGTHRAH